MEWDPHPSGTNQHKVRVWDLSSGKKSRTERRFGNYAEIIDLELERTSESI